MAGNTWTKEDDNKLIELRKQYTPYADIAYQMNRTPAAIKARVNDAHPELVGIIGTPARNWNSSEDEKLIEIYNRQLDAPDIAIRMQRSVDSVIYRLCQLGKEQRVKLRDGYSAKSHNTDKKPQMKLDVKQRRCLRCSDDFLSEWIGHRLCSHCKPLVQESMFVNV